ncbi:MAG: hypothetical protein AB1635_05895 [Acidobacteriota bacterium]
MKNTFLVLAGLAFSVTLAAAQAPSVTGTLIDNMCFKPSMGQAELAKHTRECALMDGCVKAGYAVVTADGHVYKLDAAGNEKAVAALKASTKAADLKVTVTGPNEGGTIKVASITLAK